MRSFLFFALMLLFSCAITAQARIAIISGTTNQLKTTTSLDSALQMASDGDFIYLPGVTYPTATIKKRVFIFGAGTYPDSTGTTGRSIITNLIMDRGASGGVIEGCTITATLRLLDNVENFIVKRCNISQLSNYGKSNFFIENIIRSSDAGFNNTYSNNSTYKKNLIGGISYEQYGTFQNNIFYTMNTPMKQLHYCTFQNNIFLTLGDLIVTSSENFFLQ